MIGGFANLNQFDPDAAAFIQATGIAGIEAEAINQLVNQLKAAGLWGLMYAIYPMVGGTAFTHKFNLKNPQDTNAAYRLSFAGGWTHNSSGAKPDGVSGTYADTFAAPSSLFGLTDGSFSYYSFTNNAGADDVEIGCNDGAATTFETLLAFRFSDNNQYAFINQVGTGGGAPGNSWGYFIGNRPSSSTEGWKNGTRVINTSQTAPGRTSRTFYLGAQNNGTTSYRNSSRGCAFSHIGAALPTGGPFNLNNIVNNYQKTLQRNVF
jgi:hypothetical protein